MKITTVISALLVILLTISAQADTGYQWIDSINLVPKNSTGYCGYLVASPNAPTYFAGSYTTNFGQSPDLSDYSADLGSAIVAITYGHLSEPLPRNMVASPPSPALVQNYQLDVAAMLICREMFRQDWQGANFPDGKTLAYFLAQAGWTGDPSHVIAITLVKPPFHQDELVAEGFNKGGNWVAKRFPQIANPAVQSFGYATGARRYGHDPDGGRVNGFYYETTLLCTDAVSVQSEALYDYWKVVPFFSQRGAGLGTTKITGRKGTRLIPRGIVVTSKQLVGRARIKGHLPPGVYFNGHTGRFTGTPRKAGTRRVQITATYRLVGGEGASGTHTTRAVIRIRR
ncbi:MAG: putative Ig domain-containing protein [Chthoniobacterales bacterium]